MKDMKLFNNLSEAARKRRAYNRTVNEMSAMTLSTAIDLNIYHEDIPQIARKAVYGK